MPKSAYPHSSSCPAGACRAPAVTPPWCCPEPSVDTQRARVERQAHWAQLAAAGNPIAVAHAATEREQALLTVELDLAERRVGRLACGLGCLQSRIDATRAGLTPARARRSISGA